MQLLTLVMYLSLTLSRPRGFRFISHSINIVQRNNVHVKAGVSVNEFVDMRNTRDATLSVPRLLLPAIQVNIRAGAMPPKESNGHVYLKIPLNIM